MLAATHPAAMVQKYFTQILYVTGVITMLPLLQFFAPAEVLRVAALQVTEDAGLFHAQHWGLLAFCFGALLVYAARHPAVRKPIVLAAGLEKLGLCALAAAGWNNPALHGLRGPLAVDGLCVLLYAAWLLTAPRDNSASNKAA
jgi:hypothetical protein